MSDQYCSKEGVYLNSKREIVYGKDPDRKTQLVAPGGCIPVEDARRMGIDVDRDTPKKEPEPQAKAVNVAPENKAIVMPAAGKPDGMGAPRAKGNGK